MPVKNTVAVERRTDLASLFCMIGRHGPAVALAVIAMVSVVAGYIFYKNVRGKRSRKATGDETSASGDESEKDASTIRTDEEPEPSESTDANDDGSSHAMVDHALTPSRPSLRHRRSPSAEKLPTFCPPQTETLAQQESSRVADSCEEEATHSLQGNSTSATAVGVTDEEDCRHSLTEDAVNNVESCLAPKPVYEEIHTDDGKVFQGKCDEDRNTIVEDVSQGKTSKEDNLHCISDSPLCSEQDIPISESTNDLKWQGVDTTQNTSSHLEKQTEGEEDICEVADVLSCVSCEVCFEDLYVTETSDRLRGSGATPDTNDQSDKPVRNMADCKNTTVENLCASSSLSVFTQDSEINGNLKVQCSEVAPNAISSLEGPTIEIEKVSHETVDPENSQCVSKSPVCLEQEFYVSENGNDHKLQIGELSLGPDSNLEESVNNEDEPVSELCEEKEVPLEENCQAECSDIIKNDAFEEENELGQVFDQQLGCLTSKQDTNVLCLQQDWCHAANNLLLSSQEDDHFQTIEVTEELRGEDNLHNHTEVTLDFSAPEVDIHQLQDEHNGDKSFAHTEEESETEVVGSRGDECENSVSCLNQSVDLAEDDEGNETHVEASDVYPPTLSDDKQPSEARRDEVTPVLVVVEQNVADECFQEEIVSERNGSDEVVVVAGKGKPCGASCYKDQQSDATESWDMFADTENPSADAVVRDLPNSSSVASPPDASSSSQSDQIQNASAFPEVGGGTSDTAGYDDSGQISLSLSESQLTRSFSGFGVESGISSMVVSPDLSDALEFGTAPEHMLPSPMDSHPYSEEPAESQIIFTHDATVSFNEELVGVALESCQNPPQTNQNWAVDSSFAVNEDIFGNDIEDGYYSTMGQLIAANAMNLTDEFPKEACNEVPVLVVQIDGKEVVKRKEVVEKKEVEDDLEKTEISIMEATMDNNEWITDGNYQVLPWMNLSTTTFPQIPSIPHHSPDDTFSLPDAACIEKDIPLSTEACQTDTLSLDENLDGSKKVLAVQPMPQNVNVTFRIHYLTQSPYQKLAVTGNHEDLGNWKEFVLLEKAKDGHWSSVVSLPAESHVEWKFVVLDKGGVCRWEECGNRLLETGYGEDLIVHKWWGFL